jgi:adenylosuccinate synthase
MHHNALRCGMGVNTVDKAELKRQLLDIAPKILIYSDPVWKTLNYIQRMGSSILFEGAQAVMLDVDHGTYPFVTSSNTVAGQASIGSGLGPHMTGNVLGICKAYTTRVGSGPFPTELHDRIGKLLSENGKEFGTVTGRPRRCGWFDAVMVRQAIKLGGVKALALTKIDVLDSLDEIKVCIGYKHGSETLDYFPADPFIQSNIEPIYEIIPGWKQSIRGAKNISDIPSNAVKYIKRLEELIDIPVILVSTSPDRDDTIMIQDPFCN